MNEVRMFVEKLILDPKTQAPIIILKDEDKRLALPIWIGPFEASAIAMAIEGMTPPRPMTHDLIAAILEESEMKVEKVIVTDLRDQTYYAEVHLALRGDSLLVDSRPSDAIAIAVRTDSPIFVSARVAEAAIVIDDFMENMKKERYKEFLEALDPDDFSKYKM